MLLSSIPILDHKCAFLKKPEYRDRNEKLYMAKDKVNYHAMFTWQYYFLHPYKERFSRELKAAIV